MKAAGRKSSLRMLMFAVRVVALILVAVGLQSAAAPAAPFDQQLVQDRICTSNALVSSILRSVASSPELTRQMRAGRGSINYTLIGNTISITGPSGDKTSQMTAQPPRSACAIEAIGRTLSAPSGQIPALYLQAFDAVKSYRLSHTWPYSAVDLSNASTELVAERYGSDYVLVFASEPPHGPPLSLGCSTVEYYSFAVNTGEILPFDGCVEAHKHVFPPFGSLPAN